MFALCVYKDLDVDADLDASGDVTTMCRVLFIYVLSVVSGVYHNEQCNLYLVSCLLPLISHFICPSCGHFAANTCVE